MEQKHNAVALHQNHQPVQAYFPNEADWRMMLDVGNKALKSGMLPAGIKSPEAAAIIALKARELNMPLMVGFAHIHVINGKPTLSAEMMQALARKNLPGLVINIIESTNEKATVEIIRPEPGSKSYKLTFTIEDAKKAELTKNLTWSKYPAAMLWSRAVSAGLRKVCPEALIGVSYTPEEMGAQVDQDGNVIHTTGKRVEEHGEQPAAAVVHPITPKQPAEDPAKKLVIRGISDLMKELAISPEDAQHVLQSECGADSLKTATLDQLQKFHAILKQEKETIQKTPEAPINGSNQQENLAPWEAELTK
jgi:ERCC4-type nuclease